MSEFCRFVKNERARLIYRARSKCACICFLPIFYSEWLRNPHPYRPLFVDFLGYSKNRDNIIYNSSLNPL